MPRPTPVPEDLDKHPDGHRAAGAPAVERVAKPHVPLAVVVVIACLAQFMGVFQESVVSVALPAMREHLHLSTSGQAWVVNGYMITFGGFLLLAARASDLIGRKRVFLAGLAVFTVAGLAAGLAHNSGWLIGALVVQGIGAAAIAPASLSLITASHPEGPARTKALAVWSVAATSAAPLGLVIGGVLTSELSWRYVLFLNALIAAAVLVAASRSLASSPRASRRQSFDLLGSLTVTLGSGGLIYSLSEAGTSGWGSAEVVSSLAVAAVLLTAFVAVEARSTAPLVPLSIFRNRNLTLANVAIVCVGIALTAQLFFVSLYLQQVIGYSALRTGVAMVPMSIAMIAGAVAAKSLAPRMGTRTVLVAGAVAGGGGVAWLSRLPVTSDYAAHILGPTLVLGAGVGLMILPVTEAATAGVAPHLAGLASGLFNVTRQIGGAVGLAVLVTIATTVSGHSHAAGAAEATVQGYRFALLICAAGTVAAVLPVLFLSRPAGTPAAEASDALPAPAAP